MAEDAAATVDIDFVAGNIDVLVVVNIALASIAAAPAVPAVPIVAYGVAIVIADVVVIIIVIGPFHNTPSQKPSHHHPGEQGIGR